MVESVTRAMSAGCSSSFEDSSSTVQEDVFAVGPSLASSMKAIEGPSEAGQAIASLAIDGPSMKSSSRISLGGESVNEKLHPGGEGDRDHCPEDGKPGEDLLDYLCGEGLEAVSSFLVEQA